MVSPGRLVLLLMSSLLLSAVIVSTAPDQKEVVKEDLKEIFNGIRKKIDNIRVAVTPFLGLIPVAGPYISAGVTLALVAASGTNPNPVLATLKSEFESLNFKLDEYHIEQTWDTWASGAYHKPEMEINLGWAAFDTFLSSVQQALDEDEKQRHTKAFIETYLQYEPATRTLHQLLTAKGTTFIYRLGELLAEHVSCHEKAIREYTVFIELELILKGNILNQLYYKLKEIESPARDEEGANIAYESASAMFQIHKHCIVNSIEYIKKDVIRQIDQTKHRGKLAKRVRSFLADTYDRYDWMVVAFITEHSDRMIKTLNKHSLSGFTEVTKGEVSVAVARQVKGSHKMAAKVYKAISKCFANSAVCKDVEKTLKECREPVGEIPVSQTWTAVHAFTDKAHDSYEEEDLKEEDSSAYSPFIYVGKCDKSLGIKGGRFVVMIKSDEELTTTDPCSKLTCNKPHGECVRVENTFLAMCECTAPYYGQHCEESLDDYKKELQEKRVEVDEDGNMWVVTSV